MWTSSPLSSASSSSSFSSSVQSLRQTNIYLPKVTFKETSRTPQIRRSCNTYRDDSDTEAHGDDNSGPKLSKYSGAAVGSKEGKLTSQQDRLMIPASRMRDNRCTSPSSNSSYNKCRQKINNNINHNKESVDEYISTAVLGRNSILEEQYRRLLSSRVELFDDPTKQRIVYVSQREIVHVTRNECDVVVSDRATTCHIVMFCSTLVIPHHFSNESSSSNSFPDQTNGETSNGNERDCIRLCTVAHIDDPSYDECIRTAIKNHQDYHSERYSKQQQQQEESKKIHVSMNTDRTRLSLGAAESLFVPSPSISIEIHIVGGFDDESKASQKISNWLLHLLADIADEFYKLDGSDEDHRQRLEDASSVAIRANAITPLRVTMTLRTIAVSSMNSTGGSSDSFSRSYQQAQQEINNSYNNQKNLTCQNSDDSSSSSKSLKCSPIIRGLAIDCRTGFVFVAKCVSYDVMGPALLLRHARLWFGSTDTSGCGSTSTLMTTMISSPSSSLVSQEQQPPSQSLEQTKQAQKTDWCYFTIEPFIYYPYDYLVYLSSIEDDYELLCAASTSPSCEEDDFCSMVRKTIQFISNVPYTDVFRSSDGTEDSCEEDFRGVARRKQNTTDTAAATTTRTTQNQQQQDPSQACSHRHKSANDDMISTNLSSVLNLCPLVFRRLCNKDQLLSQTWSEQPPSRDISAKSEKIEVVSYNEWDAVAS
jgi:Protein N-terminal asparagine amidohydrolase